MSDPKHQQVYDACMSMADADARTAYRAALPKGKRTKAQDKRASQAGADAATPWIHLADAVERGSVSPMEAYDAIKRGYLPADLQVRESRYQHLVKDIGPKHNPRDQSEIKDAQYTRRLKSGQWPKDTCKDCEGKLCCKSDYHHVGDVCVHCGQDERGGGMKFRKNHDLAKRCGRCGRTFGTCPECGDQYPHGSASHCTRAACKKMNAPIDCGCGFVVSEDKDGVLDLNMNLIPWKRTTSKNGLNTAENERGYNKGFEAAREVAGKFGLTLADKNLRDLEIDQRANKHKRSSFDYGYLQGYKAGVKSLHRYDTWSTNPPKPGTVPLAKVLRSLGLPEDADDLIERNQEFIFEMSRLDKADKQGLSEEEIEVKEQDAEVEVSDQIYRAWQKSIESALDLVAETCWLGIEVNWEKQTAGIFCDDWTKCAQHIRSIINGIGLTDGGRSLKEALDMESVSTPRQYVLKLWFYVSHHSEVYGGTSIVRIYERNLSDYLRNL